MDTESRKHRPPGRAPEPPHEGPRVGIEAPGAAHLHAQDHWRVNLGEAWEVLFWSREFGCTEDELRQAVQVAGTLAGDVRAHLDARKDPRQ